VIVSLSPVVVFVDEIDQAIGQRDTGASGDSGTSARMFGRILEFMGSNEHRGDVVWIGATNRPDLLDAAMLRRFDRIVPMLMPGEKEREQIFKVMPRQISPELDQEAFYAPDADLGELARTTQGLTGAAIEMIVRRAREIADNDSVTTTHLIEARRDFKPNHDQDTYDMQSMIALQQANFYSALPTIPNEYPYNKEPYSKFVIAYGEETKIDPDKLNAVITSKRADRYLRG
ncbi:MAG TPA: ATP-binding protein, partial [Chloroflexia bacterium]|nr:ATP-binding protein [Chloroflexia bacterium]